MKRAGEILQAIVGQTPQNDAEIARAIERLRQAEKAASRRWRHRARRVRRRPQ